MEYICKCNKCDSLFIDTNPQVKSPKIEVDSLELDELIDHKCPTCKVDDYLTDDVYKFLWELLGETFVDDDGYIMEGFLHFEVGTDREEVWAWFEETFNISVGKEFF